MSSDSPNAASAGGAHSRGGSKSPLTTHRRPSVQERRRVSEVPGLLHQDGVLPSGKYVDPAERMRSGGSSQVERLKTADSGGRLKTADSSGGSSGGGGSARVMSKTGKLLVVNVQQETQKEIVTSSGNRLKVAARRSSQLPSPSPTPGRASPDVVGSPALGARARRGSREGRQSSLEDFAGSPKQGASSRRTSREVAGSRSPQQGGRGRRASRGGDASPAPARSRQASREPVPHLGSSGPQTSRGSQLLGLEAFSVVAEQAQVVAEARVGGDKFAAEFAASSVQVWSEEEDVAATKIQSIARGMQTRKSLKNVALEQALEDDSASSGSYSSSGSDSVASFMLQKHPVTLQVEAKEGKIETRNIPGGTFPYLVVNCGEYQQATSSVQVDTNSPFWKDTFVFSIDNLEDDLVINCHHWDGRNRGPGRNLGQVVFNLRHLLVGNLAEDLNSSVHGSGSASRRDEANTSRATDTPVFREGSANLSTNLSSNRKPWSKNTMKQQSSLRRMGSGASAQLPGDKKSRPTSSNRTGHEQTTSSDRSSVGQRARPPSLSHGLNRHPGDTAYNREVSSRSPLSSNQSTPRNNARDSARHSGSGGGNSTPSSQQSGAASTLAPMMQMRARKGKVHKHGALSFQEFEQWMPFIDPVSGKKIGRGAGLRLRLRPWAPGGLTAKDLPGSEEDEAPVKGIFGFFRRKGPVKKSEDSSEEGDAAKEERGDDDSEFQSTSSDEKSVAALSDSDASNDYSTPDEIDEQIPPTDRGFSSHIPVPCDAVMRSSLKPQT
ncbi:hypothetical protein T484DRAFT_3263784 [Baffinella frigidus]|nr:hypothetical protein T484DRAFT_3263784 [Cryptophyta sp. CCMP2293]